MLACKPSSRKKVKMNTDRQQHQPTDWKDSDLMNIDDYSDLEKINKGLESRRRKSVELTSKTESQSQHSEADRDGHKSSENRVGQEVSSHDSPAPVRSALIIDTNFIISHLKLVDELKQQGPQFGHVIVIPWVVVQELDGLKSNSKGLQLHSKHSVSSLARSAIRWVYNHLAERDPYVIGQKLTQVCSGDITGDDAILDCCRYFRENNHLLTVILSNDRNLCTKALIHSVKTVSFVKDMTALEISTVVSQEADNFPVADTLANGQSDEVNSNPDYMELDDDYQVYDPQQPDSESNHVANTSTAMQSSTPSNARSSTAQPLAPAPTVSKSPASPDLSSIRSYKDFQDISQNIVQFLEVQISHLVKIHLNNAYDPEELEYFSATPSHYQTMHGIGEVIKRFSLSVFSPLIPRNLINKLPRHTFVPIDKKDLNDFVDVWGAVWIYLSKYEKNNQNVPKQVAALIEIVDEINEDD